MIKAAKYRYLSTQWKSMEMDYNKFDMVLYKAENPHPPDDSGTWRLISAVVCGDYTIGYWEQIYYE